MLQNHRSTNLKWNVAIMKDLNTEFVTKNGFIMRTQCKIAIRLYSSPHATGMILYAVAVELYRVSGSTTNANRLCARARQKLLRPLETKRQYIHLSSDSRRPFNADLHIHYHL